MDREAYDDWDTYIDCCLRAEQKEKEEMADRKPRTLEEVTLADIMGQNFNVILRHDDTYGFHMHMEGWDEDFAMDEKQISPEAMEALNLFCKRFQDRYELLTTPRRMEAKKVVIKSKFAVRKKNAG